MQTLNLRLSGQNLLKTDIRRQQEAYAGAVSWSLNPTERGVRMVMLALEGKW